MITNETLETLRNRRSCKAYKPEQIKEDELDTILDAGTWAPTGMGKQSPIMIAVQDKEDIAELERINAEIFGKPGASLFYGAPTVVVVLAEETFERPDGKALLKKWGIEGNYVGIGNCVLGYSAAAPKEPIARKENYITKIK